MQESGNNVRQLVEEDLAIGLQAYSLELYRLHCMHEAIRRCHTWLHEQLQRSTTCMIEILFKLFITSVEHCSCRIKRGTASEAFVPLVSFDAAICMSAFELSSAEKFA